ncbi:hypothetical protein [Vibrio rotiferianus]|uniref:hypothetical protein n=1 Tax=Vibrio rotiferianus TaxID=190895 RepID=UPI002490F34E|nr:hypothetical protein [Vibrio rotiferianus]
MIRIDLKSKLLNCGSSLPIFEQSYVDKIFSKKYTTVLINNGVASDRFNIYPNLNSQDLLNGGGRKLNICELFFKVYQNDIDFKRFVDHGFNSILNLGDAERLIKEIILIKPSDLDSKVTSLSNSNQVNSVLNKKIYSIFNYDKHSSTKFHSIRDSFSSLKFKVCIYCNRNYTSNFLSKGRAKPTFTLDHFYQKEKHPIFSLSLYNLIPSCSVCNSTIKGSNDLEHYENPFSDLYDFDGLATFKIMPDYKVSLVSQDAKCRGYIRDFKINEVYSAHTSEVESFMKKRQVFTNQVIREVAKITNSSEEMVKNKVFGDFQDQSSMGDRSLAKLMSDLYSQLRV